MEGYILKLWFKEPTNILELLPKEKILPINGKEDVVFAEGEERIYILHCSWGKDLENCKKLKVYLWMPYLYEDFCIKEIITWEDREGDRFISKYLKKIKHVAYLEE